MPNYLILFNYYLTIANYYGNYSPYTQIQSFTWCHFDIQMHRLHKTNIGGMPFLIRNIPPIALNVRYMPYSSMAACAAQSEKLL